MSESQEYEEITVTSDGVAVTKTFEEDAFPVPAIAFRIRSDRMEPVTVRLVDDVPDSVAVEDLGFHPEYGSEYWTIEDEEITFEREIDAESKFTTVYGIRATGTDDIEQFLTEPELAEVDPPLEDGDEVVSGASNDVVRDVISGDADSVPGLDDEEDIGTFDLNDPDGEGETETDVPGVSQGDAADADGTDAADAGGAEPGQSDGTAGVESVASALADEIREGKVEDDDLELLREELDLEDTDSAVDARIEKLQTDVSDLQAYIDALEEFLEENGTGQQLLEDVQAQMDDLQSEIEENSEWIDTVESLEAEVESLGDTVSAFDDDVESIRGDLDNLQTNLGDVDDVEDRVDSIDQEISELKEWREQLSNVLGAAED